MPGHISRRRFIIGTAAAVGGAAFLNACGDDDDDNASATGDVATGGAATTAGRRCGDHCRGGDGRHDQDRLCHAPDRRTGTIWRGRHVRARRSPRGVRSRRRDRRHDVRDRDPRPRLRVELEHGGDRRPGVDRAGRRAADVRRPDARHHGAGRPDLHEQRDSRAVQQRAVATALPRNRRQARTRHHTAGCFRVELPLLLGARGRDPGLPRDVEERRAGWRGRRDVARRPGRQRVERPERGLPAGARGRRLHARRPRPIPARHDRLHRPDLAVQGRRCRDRHRRDDPARLRCVLDAVPAAGLPAEGGDARQVSVVPERGRLVPESDRSLVGDLVVRPPSHEVEPHWSDRRPISPPRTRPPRAVSGRSLSATCTRCSRSRSTR